MTNPVSAIEEMRFAAVELNLIRQHVKALYGENPPVHVLNEMTELAKNLRLRHSTFKKPVDDQELQNFCIKNGLTGS